jgi:hypothetical protein
MTQTTETPKEADVSLKEKKTTVYTLGPRGRIKYVDLDVHFTVRMQLDEAENRARNLREWERLAALTQDGSGGTAEELRDYILATDIALQQREQWAMNHVPELEYAFDAAIVKAVPPGELEVKAL